MNKKIFLLFIFSFPFFSAFSQSRKVALLDLSVRNNETNFSRIRSCIQIMDVAGVEYDTTSSVTAALTHPIVFITPIIYNSTFTPLERTALTNYVNNGGTLIASSLRDNNLYSLFGITGYAFSSTHFSLQFDTQFFPELYHYIDDTLEKKVSFGGLPDTAIFTTHNYTISTGSVLARYEDNTNGIVFNQYGNGRTYVFGFDLRDAIMRNETNQDLHAARSYSNGFEPTSDVFSFFIANIIRKHIPNTVRLHTSPYCTSASVLISHDMDSHTAVDTMHFFVDMENSRNIKANYLVTTRYMDDGWLDSFYCYAHVPLLYVLSKGGVLGSHSVGHFLDFDDGTTFPLGSTGNTRQNYHPAYSITNMFTTGGTVMGEAEVSQEILLNDFGVSIKTFRSGFLNYNDRLPKALQILNYKYNSSFSANDVLCNFPYRATDQLKFSGEQENALEIPMTISDVFSSDPITDTNYAQKVSQWVYCTKKNIDNHAPTVILIHPNRQYKVTAEAMWLDSLTNYNLNISNIDEYGDFWLARDSMDFYSVKTNGSLAIHMNTNAPDNRLSFIIDNADTIAIAFYLLNGQQLLYNSYPFDNNSRIYCNPGVLTGLASAENGSVSARAYPNPGNDLIHIDITGNLPVGCELKIYNMLGELIYTEKLIPASTPVLQTEWRSSHEKAGFYFYTVSGSSIFVQGNIILSK